MIKRLLIFGCGGHGRELFWVAQRTLPRETRIEFVVDHERFLIPDVKGAPVHLFEDLKPDSGSRFIIALGDAELRERAAEKMQTRFEPTSLVDPSVIMGGDVTIGPGSILMPGCILTTNITLGSHCHLNIGCRVSHDVRLADFSTLSPGVQVSGSVHIGRSAFLGTGVSTINGSPDQILSIGSNSIVAAGACVIRDVPDSTMVAGVPAIPKAGS